jgi:dihydrofolate synthase/folylpolyglutamate synthase
MKNSDAPYQAALDYIYSFVDHSRTHQENLSPENFDLSRMWALMESLGNPQDAYQSLHIAGSKGKGSVSAFCASVLQEAGYKVGMYTSPHLKDFEERIQVNGVPIPRQDLVELLEDLKPHIAAIPRLTTFEIITGLGFVYFARQEVDLAVIEVGLGGRLDATNVVTPLVSVITPLYLEHTMILGDTLAEIAAEKGGIIKPGVPVVLAPQKPEPRQTIEAIAREQEAPLVQVGRDYRYRSISNTLAGQVFQVAKTEAELEADPTELHIPLLGAFQVDNAAVAYAALKTAAQQGLEISEAALKQGLRKTVWPARFEVIRQDPPVVIDSAHNPAAIVRLMEAVEGYFQDTALVVVFGISADKDLPEMYDVLLPHTSYLICTQADHPRALDAAELWKAAEPFDISGEVVPEVGKALQKALQKAGDQALVLVTGSIFVAASARIAWEEGRQE